MHSSDFKAHKYLINHDLIIYRIWNKLSFWRVLYKCQQQGFVISTSNIIYKNTAIKKVFQLSQMKQRRYKQWPLRPERGNKTFLMKLITCPAVCFSGDEWGFQSISSATWKERLKTGYLIWQWNCNVDSVTCELETRSRPSYKGGHKTEESAPLAGRWMNRNVLSPRQRHSFLFILLLFWIVAALFVLLSFFFLHTIFNNRWTCS